MAKIGYVRVSTDEQNTARQNVIMNEIGVDKLFSEKISGKDTKRPELQKMMDYIREGDVVIVESYSRLARSTADLLSIVAQITGKGAQFVSQKENFDTDTPQGRFMMTVFAGLAQLERECLLERQREGIAVAKSDGKYKGRQPVPIDTDQFAAIYSRWKNQEITAVQAFTALRISKNTFYRRVREYEGHSNH